MAAKSEKAPWRRGTVETVKEEVRRELAGIADEDARRDHVLARIAALDGGRGQDLRRLVYVISALVGHSRRGDLKPVQVQKLVQLAMTILKAGGVDPERSRLAHLYAEIHLVMSQIHQRSGRVWQAAWEQQLAEHLTRNAPLGGTAFTSLSRGLRALRLGETGLALQDLRDAESETLPPRLLVKARLSMVKALRLRRDAATAAALLARLAAMDGLTAPERRELVWEETCLIPDAGRRVAELARLVERGREHHLPEYLVEASLWTRALPEGAVIRPAISMRYLARKSGMAPQRLGRIYRIAVTTEDLYNSRIPLPFRLAALGDHLAEVSELSGIDKELLTFAAAARWLAKARQTRLACLTIGRYRALSLQVSGGETDDCLGTTSDLITKPWYGQPGPRDAFGHAEDGSRGAA